MKNIYRDTIKKKSCKILSSHMMTIYDADPYMIIDRVLKNSGAFVLQIMHRNVYIHCPDAN